MLLIVDVVEDTCGKQGRSDDSLLIDSSPSDISFSDRFIAGLLEMGNIHFRKTHSFEFATFDAFQNHICYV